MSAAARDPSLDAFRGLTVLMMVLVNLQAPGHAFRWLDHAPWNGLTIADLVFPWFLMMIGLSVPLAIDGRRSGVGRIVRRSTLLFAIGMILALLIRPTIDPSQIRWASVLQRIAIVYLACALLARTTRWWRVPAIAALLCFGVHSLLLLTPAPGHTLPSLVPGEGMAGWLDRLLLPGRLHRTTWDPEGVLSTLPAIGSGLIGVATMRWRRGGGVRLGTLALALTASGAAATLLAPINKALWTTSFALVTAGLGLCVWLGLGRIWPRIAGSVGARLLTLAGRTALTLYVVHMLLIAILVRILPDGRSIWTTLYDALVATGLTPPLASLLFAIAASAVSLATIPPLEWRGWVLRV